MRLLLISNSTNAGEEYLRYPIQAIGHFLGDIGEVLFVPYAAVSFSYDDYLKKVQDRFAELSVEVRSVHQSSHPEREVEKAHAIIVGGGNTFALLKKMQEQKLLDPIRERVVHGHAPYVGWSAGSNMACPTICTTNDMPIVEPDNFRALGLIKFQINPHYLDAHPAGHAGETREQRIEEYIEANRNVYVAGLREGCILRMDGSDMELIGPRSMRVFHHGDRPREIEPGESLSFLL